ncbi:MAG: TraR/DksA C4-type zinc finger protein, partial [Acidimicrobiia bacterium]|nr:TraR/DksA C4-type zinc finger protein [Acidimicrobiia bacterium]
MNQEREKLVRQLEELGATESGDLRSDLEFGDGFADAGAATAERTELLGLVESLKGQLKSVDEALVKIENGSYGLCNKCGQPIPPVRLEARPASVLCFDCK